MPEAHEWTTDDADGCDNTLSDAELAPPRQRLAINPEPLEVTSTPSCQVCRKRAPWCSCGEAAYR